MTRLGSITSDSLHLALTFASATPLREYMLNYCMSALIAHCSFMLAFFNSCRSELAFQTASEMYSWHPEVCRSVIGSLSFNIKPLELDVLRLILVIKNLVYFDTRFLITFKNLVSTTFK